MRLKRFNRRAEEDESGHVLIGLVLLAIILFALTIIIVKYGKEIISFAGNEVKKGLLNIVVDSGSALTKASEPNFERLNDELTSLLKSPKKIDHVVVPYAIGQLRLVGFNKDPLNGINGDCLGEKLAELKPDKCKNAACLCLCYMEESCECEAYQEVDYFITTPDQFRNKGENISLFRDPVNGDDAHCLMIKGSEDEKDTILGNALGNRWWRSNMVYLEKIDKGGKRYVFFSRYQDIQYTERVSAGCNKDDLKTEDCSTIKSCSDYKTADLGCDWTYTCQNNVCPDVGQRCNVVYNPYSQTDENSQFCLAADESIEQFCVSGPAGESAASAGRSGDLFWVESRGLCFKCIGLGQPDADNWGWAQDPAVNKNNCKTT